MATITRPTFPDPALEVGVAQYPTPLVPDYYTKTGHIILVEKVSIEKGTYNPQPLDGSVTYTGRDANDWPSTLYLVFQQTEPTGKFVFNYWANDRTLASQDPWNYGLEYSLNHPSYKIITRTYITPRATYSPVALGSVDPVFGGTAIIAQQQMVELPDDNPLRSRYVQVQRVYETVPSSVITGKVMSEFGIATATKQVVVAGTAIATPSANTISSQISAEDAVKSTLEKVEYDSLNTITGYQYDEFFDVNFTITRQIVSAATGPLSPTNGILSYKDEAIDPYKKQRTIVYTPSLPPQRVEYLTGTFQSPLLVFNITATAESVFCGEERRIRVTPTTRSSQSRQTIFRTTTSYSYGPPAVIGDTGLLAPELKEVTYTGYIINFNLGAALCDNLVAPDTFPAINPNQGLFINQCFIGMTPVSEHFERWDIAATTPTATEYLDLIGTYQPTSWETKYWKAGIWQTKAIETLIV
jgi:hypothetical protein